MCASRTYRTGVSFGARRLVYGVNEETDQSELEEHILLFIGTRAIKQLQYQLRGRDSTSKGISAQVKSNRFPSHFVTEKTVAPG